LSSWLSCIAFIGTPDWYNMVANGDLGDDYEKGKTCFLEHAFNWTVLLALARPLGVRGSNWSILREQT
jgi:hypothetical protein